MTFLCLWLVENIFAQIENQILPVDMEQMTVVTEPPTLPKGNLRLGESIGFSMITGREFNEKGRRVFFSESSNYWNTEFNSRTYLSYGISNRLQVDMSAAYCIKQGQFGNIAYAPSFDTIIDASTILKGKGLNNLKLSMSFQILPQTEKRLSSLTGMVEVWIPAGSKNPKNVKDDHHYDLPTSIDNYVTQFVISYKKIHYPFSYTMEVSYVYQFAGKKKFSATDQKEINFKSGNSIGGGAGLNFHLNKWIVLTNEIGFFSYAYNTIEGKKVPGYSKIRNSLVYGGNLIFHVKRFRISEGVIARLAGKNISADPTYYLALEYLF